MGLVQAVKGAVGGVLADQWKDFYTVPTGLPSTAALFAAVPRGTNAGRGSNTSGSSNIISNGSKIIVPEGYGLLLFQDGAITAFVAEPGGYEWRSDDLNSQSIFAGDGLVSTFIKQSWERFKFGGQPGSQQAAYFVSLKELPDNRFGTQSEIYWDDGFLNTQVGAVTRGSYTLKIVDPILFVKNFVPASYLQPGQVFGSRPGHRQDRHCLDRVRRQHPRTAEDRPARRCAVRLARQFQPAGERRPGHPVGRRERRCGRPGRGRHGLGHVRCRRHAAAGHAGCRRSGGQAEEGQGNAGPGPDHPGRL